MNSQQGLRDQLSSTDSTDDEDEDLPFVFDLEENFEERDQRRPENPIHKLLNEAEINETEEMLGGKRTRSSDSTEQVLTSSGERWEFNKSPRFMRSPLLNSIYQKSIFSQCYLVPVDDSASHSLPLHDNMEKDFVRMDIDLDSRHSLAAAGHAATAAADTDTDSASPTNHSMKKTKLNNIFGKC